MSVSYKVKANQGYLTIDLKKQIKSLFKGYKNLKIEKVDDNSTYFYLYGMSTRGVNISVEDNGFRIRNTVLSNRIDLLLSFKLLCFLSIFTGSKIYDENDEIVQEDYFLNLDDLDKKFESDVNSVLILIENTKQTMEFPGPTRSVYIGDNLIKKLRDSRNNINIISKEIENIFLKVLYGLPDYIVGSLMSVESIKEGEMIKLKLVSKDDNRIIQNYDYIFLEVEKEGDKIIMLDNKSIRKILPDSWELADECTIIAPKLTSNEWENFKNISLKYNCFDEYNKKAKKRK